MVRRQRSPNLGINPRLRCCKNCPANHQDTAYNCFKRGIGTGRNLTRPITAGMPKDIMRQIARNNGMYRYWELSREDMFETLQLMGVTTYKPFKLY